MDTAQILLLTVVAVLSILLVLLGMQVFFILREFKNTISKANKVLDDAGVITGSISRPVESFSTVISTVKVGSILASLLAKKQHKKEEKDARKTQ